MQLLNKVHFQRSVKRVSERVNRHNEEGHRIFTTIGYGIPKATSKEDVLSLFAVLAGDEPLETAGNILNDPQMKEYSKHHNQTDWAKLNQWKQWWTKPRHLGM